MYNQMLDGNSAAELDNDRFMSQVEQCIQDNERRDLWKYSYAILLSGKPYATYSRVFRLKERMSDKYQDFSDLVDLDVDFMWMYKNGKLQDDLRKLMEHEAADMADAIVDEVF